MDPSKNGRGHVFLEVFLMPNTHTRALGRAGGRAGAFRPPVVIIFSDSLFRHSQGRLAAPVEREDGAELGGGEGEE